MTASGRGSGVRCTAAVDIFFFIRVGSKNSEVAMTLSKNLEEIIPSPELPWIMRTELSTR
jgi:hypothetical protein